MVGDSKRVAELIEGLEGGPPQVRAKCAQNLGGIGLTAEEATKAVVALIVAVKDDDPRVQKNACLALSKIGSAAVPALIEALKDDLWVVRSDAAWTLGEIGPQAVEAIPALLEALKDDDAWVRTTVASAMDRIEPAAKDDRRR